MVEKEEILRVAELMRIRIEDHGQYVGQVQRILEYFDTLDAADVESEELDHRGTRVDGLRKDEYSAFGSSLIDSIKNHDGTHVRSPKMI